MTMTYDEALSRAIEVLGAAAQAHDNAGDEEAARRLVEAQDELIARRAPTLPTDACGRCGWVT